MIHDFILHTSKSIEEGIDEHNFLLKEKIKLENSKNKLKIYNINKKINKSKNYLTCLLDQLEKLIQEEKNGSKRKRNS